MDYPLQAVKGLLDCASAPDGYPNKLQSHVTCGFDFRHGLRLPFAILLSVLKGLINKRMSNVY